MNTAAQIIHGTVIPCRQRRSSGLRTEMLAAAWMLAATAGLGIAGQVQAQTVVVTKGKASAATKVPPTTTSTNFATVGPALELIIGKSTLMRLPSPIERISVGNPNIADVSLISPVELYLLGKNYGSTNLVIWRKGGGTTAIDVNVSIDADRMERKLSELLPDEKGIRVRPAADSVILTGVVSSAMKAKYAEDIANAFVREINKNLVIPVTAGDVKAKAGTAIAVGGGSGSGAKVVNLLQVMQAQQVMLEVKVAEVSKTLLDKLGSNWNLSGGVGMTYGILSGFAGGGGGTFTIDANNGNKLTLDANKTDGLFKVLAEPNIVSISGQEASFLAGGSILVPTFSALGLPGTPTEKEYGVGLKFTPTVLEGGRINLKVAPEVSELGKTITIGNGGSAASLPSFTTRRVQTTVQLMDGQSLAIAGLIKNNVTENVSRMPLLGEVPVLGALFRSSEFQNDRTELVFLITPRLVKPLDGNYILPTDSLTPPSRSEFFLGNKLEGSGNGEVAVDKRSNSAAQPGGFELNK